MNIENIKRAHQLLAKLSDFSLDEATQKINTTTELDPEVKQLALDLLQNAQQSSHYFNDKIASLFSFESEHRNQLPIGSQIDDYTITTLLGEGGMSQVYSAIRDHTDIQKPVAIKVFSPISHSTELKQRFTSEQRILSGLSHPHIIAMQHGGITASGQPYFVMELVNNADTIIDYSKQKNLNIEQKLKLIITAAEAIEYAHNNLIIHRDLKPNNIIIGDDGELKLVDFGIAKLIPLNHEPDQHTMMALTPEYAAPEQIKGENITVKADVFSLAAVAVALLTDEKPFSKDRLLNRCAHDELHLHVVLKKNIADSDLRNVLNKALQQDPKRRYQNMHEFSRDLQFWLNKKPVSASPDSYRYRIQKFCQRRPAFSASLLVLMITITAGLLLFSWQYNQTKLEARKAQAVKQFMLQAFDITDPNFTEGIQVSAQDILQMAAVKLDSNTQLAPGIKFELYQSLGIAYGQLGFLPKAINMLQQSLNIYPNNSHSLAYLCQYLFNANQEQTLDHWLNQFDENKFSDSADKNRILRIKANRLGLAGDFNGAMAIINSLTASDRIDQLLNQRLKAELYYLNGQSEKSIEIIKQALANADLKATNTLMLAMNSDLVQYYDRVGDYDTALDLSLKLVANHRKILGNNHPGLGAALNELSIFYRLKGHFEQAKTAAAESRAIFQNLYGDDSTGLSQAISNLAMIDYLEGNYEAAIEKFSQATKILAHVYSPDHPETLIAEANLATIMTASGHAKEANKLLMHVYQVENKTLGPHHRSTLITQQSLALNLAATGNYQQALKHAKNNYNLFHQYFDATMPHVINSQFVYGRVLSMAGENQQALDMLLPLEPLFKNSEELNFIKLSQFLSKIYLSLDQPSQADEYFNKTISALTTVYSKQHIKTLQARFEYAQFLKSQQRTDEADNLVKDIVSIIDKNNVSAPTLSAQLADF